MEEKSTGQSNFDSENRLRELTGLFFRLMEEFEFLRVGVFCMIGANLILIVLLLFK